MFLAPPIKTGKTGFKLPTGWEKTKPDLSVVDKWKPGWALCAVMGHVVDAIDIDPRNGGTLEGLQEALGGELPRVYGEASTPSGGAHYLVATLNVRKVGDVVPGVDLQAGNADGVGRGFIFIAPTVRESKADGEMRAYEWQVTPDLGPLLLDADDTGAGLLALARSRHGVERPSGSDYVGLTFDDLDEDKQKEADEYVNGCLSSWIKKLKEAEEWDEGVREDGGRMRGWEALTYQFAWALAKMAACPWTSFSEKDAESTFENLLPDDIAEAVPGKWYDGIVAQATDEPVDSPPWVVRGDPADDFARTPEAWPPVPQRYNDAYLCAWMVHKGLEGNWCWASGLGWMHWDERRWASASDEAVVEAVRKSLLRVSTKVLASGDTDGIKAVTSLLMKSRIAAITVLMKGVAEVPAGQFDHQNDLLNVGNGVVDLRTGDLLPWDRKYLLSRITDTEYVAGARHADWDTCLKALEPEVMDWMQVRFGQAITGWPTPDDVLPVGVGGGSNGKSTLLAGMFTALGDHMTLVPDKLLRASPNDHPTELMSVFGARVAIIEETPEAGQLNVQRLKAVLGTSRMTARGMYQNNISWTPTHSLFLMSNYVPQIRETDHGTWRRLALVRFDKTFPKNESFRSNLSVGGDGRREAVLAWLVEGAVRWYENGIPAAPARVDTDTRVWRGESDQILAFMDEGYFELDPQSCVLTNDLLEVFNRWMVSRGQSSWSANTFATRLAGHEKFRRVDRVQTRDVGGIIRHPDVVSEAPQRPWVWQGIGWSSVL